MCWAQQSVLTRSRTWDKREERICFGYQCEWRCVRASSGCFNTQVQASPGRKVVRVSKKTVAGVVLRGPCVEHRCRAGYWLNCSRAEPVRGPGSWLVFPSRRRRTGVLSGIAQKCCAAIGCLFPMTFRHVRGFLPPHSWKSCRKLVLDELPAFSWN